MVKNIKVQITQTNKNLTITKNIVVEKLFLGVLLFE